MPSLVRYALRAAPRRLLPSRSISTREPHDVNTDPEPLKDYPIAPPGSRQWLPPTGWDDVQERRNFGDPLPEHDELMSMWGPDIPPPGVTPSTALRHFVLAALTFSGIFFVTKNVLTPEPHFTRRTYPYDGLSKELGGVDANKVRNHKPISFHHCSHSFLPRFNFSQARIETEME
ncbi:hypothetical protein K435DRAFT_643703 [Dendrothele bispora CBS 962.96]|uniref:Uncharacterized protein n=1 Tax=Dendrothele bispora (strain CBS 962.96) TaxID=1314807 RepID=A0A4S8MVL0_DENBC|nr:hypothetical protein K435DRAFT_643703 [Dendrothele bispora CBS 962.96]